VEKTLKKISKEEGNNHRSFFPADFAKNTTKHMPIAYVCI